MKMFNSFSALLMFSSLSLSCATLQPAYAKDSSEEQNQFRAFSQKIFQDLGTQMESVETINLEQVYHVYPIPAPREGTYSTLYVGKRKSEVSKEEFVKGMRKHIHDVSSAFKKFGLIDYRFYLTSDFEIAIQTWSSHGASETAFGSEEAKPILKEGSKILDTFLFEEKKIAGIFFTKVAVRVSF